MTLKTIIKALVVALALLSLNASAQRGGAIKDNKDTKKVKYVDANGNPLDERSNQDQAFISERALKDGRVMVYRQTRSDIEKLVQHLKDDGEKDKGKLTIEYWTQNSCCFLKFSGCKSTCSASSCNCKQLPTAVINGIRYRSCGCVTVPPQ